MILMPDFWRYTVFQKNTKVTFKKNNHIYIYSDWDAKESHHDFFRDREK